MSFESESLSQMHVVTPKLSLSDKESCQYGEKMLKHGEQMFLNCGGEVLQCIWALQLSGATPGGRF